MVDDGLNALTALRRHWPEYLMEAWALGMFMISAGVFTVLLEYPGSPLSAMIPDAAIRRALIGVAMGLTAIALIYSPWGRRSGAHMNPAVTLAFLRLGRVARWDALFFIGAQLLGGLAGVLAVKYGLAHAFTDPPVRYAVTVPGTPGEGVAFAAEALISFGLMLAVLLFSSRTGLERFTGVFAGLLVATYITLEGPLSGMSMNPARTLASAVPARVWDGLWIYFTAPPLGMLAAAEFVTRVRRLRAAGCAKLYHARDKRCIHCGYEPADGSLAAGPAAGERT